MLTAVYIAHCHGFEPLLLDWHFTDVCCAGGQHCPPQYATSVEGQHLLRSVS